MRNFLCWVGIVLGLTLIVGLGVTVGPCWAVETHDVVVVLPSGLMNDPSSGPINLSVKNKGRWLLDILDQSGTDYIVLRSNQCRTEHVRRGLLTLSSARQVAARSFIFFGPQSGNNYAVAGGWGRLRLDSLTRVVTNSTVSGVDVPTLWLLENSGENYSGGAGNAAWLDSAGLGINAGTSGKMVANNAAAIRSKALPTQTWNGISYLTGYAKATYSVPGGITPLVTLYTTGNATAWQGNLNNKWVDSCAYAYPGAGDDTMVVWDRNWDIATLPDAKPMTFCKFAGIGYATDSLANAGIVGLQFVPDNDTEGDGTLLLYGLAHFDSVTSTYASDGKGYIFKNMKHPFQIAPVIYGLATRNLRRFSRGIYPSDTSMAYATMDSVRAYGIPVTYAGDPDSAAAYPRDFVKAMENGAARFTPQTWLGVDSSVVLAAPTATHPVDVWGRWRVRGFYGDGSGVGADTSLAAMLIWQRSLLAARVGSSRLSRCAIAPLDDYSPKQMSVERGGNAQQADSLLWAVQAAGYTCLLSNVRYRQHNPIYHASGQWGRTNPWGWFSKQEWRYNRLNNERIALLGHNGAPIYGGQAQTIMLDDSSATGTYYPTPLSVQRYFAGAVYKIPHDDFDQQWVPGNTFWSLDQADFYNTWKNVRIDAEEWHSKPQHASVVSIPFTTLSGDPANPARSGWWVLKNLNNAFININEAAGKNIIQWCYPEDIDR